MPDNSPVPAAQPSPEREAERERNRAAIERNAAITAFNARRMAERAVRLGLTPRQITALHFAAETLGEVFGFEEPPPPPAGARG